jgi:hypothetical protein
MGPGYHRGVEEARDDRGGREGVKELAYYSSRLEELQRRRNCSSAPMVATTPKLGRNEQELGRRWGKAKEGGDGMF